MKIIKNILIELKFYILALLIGITLLYLPTVITILLISISDCPTCIGMFVFPFLLLLFPIGLLVLSLTVSIFLIVYLTKKIQLTNKLKGNTYSIIYRYLLFIIGIAFIYLTNIDYGLLDLIGQEGVNLSALFNIFLYFLGIFLIFILIIHNIKAIFQAIKNFFIF